MKIGPRILAVLVAGVVCWPLTGTPPAMGQAFSGAIPAIGAEGSADGDPGSATSQDSAQFADGTRAINLGRWSEAAAIFTTVASEHGPHAAGALYWEAYALNKLGQPAQALSTCGALGRDYPSSSWIHECGALEIEIRARTGKPIQPNAAQDDDLRLLALNSLMLKDEPRALAEIQEILNGNASEKLKKEALFILGQHYSDTTYPQIVRLSYVEGDVRVARGKEAEKATGAMWEQAVANLPLETGFSLATGQGRAEIELENASTLYLAENSVLTFNDLHATAGVPYTELALLSGTVSLDVHPYVAGEIFDLKTPTDNFVTTYPLKAHVRVSSYADASAIAPLDGGGLQLPNSALETLAAGQAIALREGRRIASVGSIDPATLTEWDKWVADRIAQRSAAITEAMKASGLTAPIPGLAELNGQGRFFDCPPYGTCWEPTAAAPPREDSVQSGTEPAVPEAFAQPVKPKQNAAAASKPETAYIYEDYFPCPPVAVRYQYLRNANPDRKKTSDTSLQLVILPNNWAVCHAGSWIHQNHRYVWVVGHKRRHLDPVRWVKSGHTLAYVPLHPYDVKGRPPINRKEEAFAVNNRNGLAVEPVKLDPERPIELFNTPPREFARKVFPPLARAEEPRLETHLVKDVAASKGIAAKTPGIPLRFDAKSQSFMMTRQVMQGNRSVTVTAPVTNRGGNLQARGGNYSGGGGYRGSSGSSGGGSSGGSHGGGSITTSSVGTTSSSSAASSSSAGSHH
jgi:hypothetical protein